MRYVLNEGKERLKEAMPRRRRIRIIQIANFNKPTELRTKGMGRDGLSDVGMRRTLKKAHRVVAFSTDLDLLAASVSCNSLPPDIHLLLREKGISKRILEHSKASKKRINLILRFPQILWNYRYI